MIFRRFTVLVTIRILLLLGTVSVLALIFGDRRLFFNHIILSIVLVAQVWELIRFVSRTNRELARFFYAIRHNDFSATFKSSSLGKSFGALDEGMMTVIKAYKEVKIEREAQFQFLRLLVSHLYTGVIVVDESNNVTLINPTAAELIGAEDIRSWRVIAQQQPGLARKVEMLGPEGKKLMEINSARGETKLLSVNVRTLIVLDRPTKLITLQDINSEIEQKQVEAWHKLIRILTHEIMNSVTPISSLTETLQGMLEDREGNQRRLTDLSEDTIRDIRFSLATIQRRSDGLLRFVDNYRRLTRIPQPHFETVNAFDFLETSVKLLSSVLEQNSVTVLVDGDRNVDIKIDRALMEQVVINLINNSIHAVQGRTEGKINLTVSRHDRGTVIEVKDNGKGIPPKELPEIFVPFFTTKKDGSGIGLSLSKQIMSLHGGTIRADSVENKGTSFYLQFPSR